MIISFSGTSGSGKSTVIAQILRSKILDGKKVVVREEDSFLTIRLLKSLLGENIFSKYKDEKYFNSRFSDLFYKIFSTFCYVFYPVVVYAEFLVDYIHFQIISKDNFLLVDKFIYDHEVNFKNILGIDYGFVDWLFDHFPRPYMSFLIDIDLENAFVKRNKNSIPGKITSNELFHKKVLNHYHKIAKKHNLLIIDNNRKLEDAIKQVNKYILDKDKLLKTKKIAICGLDGAGKTTVANLLSKYANSLGVDNRIVHFVHNNLLYRLLLLAGYYKRDEPKNLSYKRSRAHSVRERVTKTSFIKAFFRFFDSYVQYLFFIVLNRNRLIIFDRYFYDYLVSFKYLNIKGRVFFARFVPEVENKFFFDSSPVISYKRKPERIKAFFVDCYKIYLEVAGEWNIKTIKTEDRKPKDILEELLDRINYKKNEL